MQQGSTTSRGLEPLWIALAALLALSPLLLRGASCGHDLSFHLLNWMEVASQWKHGVLRPFWCYHAAWNAGEPRFVFYPPLSWTLGAALSLAMPIALLPVAYIFVALTLCGLTMRHLLQDLVPNRVVLLCSCIYLANPYALFTALERSAFAELLAAAWMPLLLRSLLRKQTSVAAVAIPVALLWLTNAPAAVAGSYALLIAGTVRCVQIYRQGRWPAVRSFFARIVGGYALGLGLASIFLLPAIVQRKWVQVQMAILPGLRPVDNFLFLRTGQPDHDLVLHQASVIAVALLGLGLACCIPLLARRQGHVSWRSMHDRQTAAVAHPAPQTIALTLGILLAAILFLLTPASAAVWKYAPELSFLQFPWRLLAVGSAAVVVLFALLLRSGRLTWPLTLTTGLAFALVAGWGASALYAQPCDDEDTAAHQQAIFRQSTGFEPTDEYTPANADNDALQKSLPEAWTAVHEDDLPAAGSAIAASGADMGKQDFQFSSTPGVHYLVVRLREFRGWHATVDGGPIDLASQRNDGLVSIPIAPGTHHVSLRYRWTWDEVAGVLLSLISAGLALLLLRVRRHHVGPERSRPSGSLPAIP